MLRISLSIARGSCKFSPNNSRVYSQILRKDQTVSSNLPPNAPMLDERIHLHGLFMMEKVKLPGDFEQEAEDVSSRIRFLRKFILSCSTSSSVSMRKVLLLYLDAISNELCKVLDAAELCRNVHPDLSFKESAEQVFHRLSALIHDLNADEQVYAKVKEIHTFCTQAQGAEESGLDAEQRLFVADLTREFEWDGVHLTGGQKAAAGQTKARLLQFESLFMQNVAQEVVALTHAEAAEEDTQTFVKLGPFDPDSTTFKSLQQWMKQYRTESHETEAARHSEGEIVKHRQLLAHQLGFESHAHKYLGNKVLKTPDKVHGFLREVSAAVKPFAEKELQKLLDERELLRTEQGKAARGGAGIVSRLLGYHPVRAAHDHVGSSSSDNLTLDPWEITYLTSAYQRRQRTALGRGPDEAGLKLSAYFPLHRCVDGLRLLSEHLFGISLREQPLGRHEAWVSNQDLPSRVRKFEVYRLGDGSGGEDADGQGEMVGVVYMDLFARKNKFTGAAHFTVSCGFDNSDLCTHILRDGAVGADLVREVRRRQRAVVALVFNFAAPGRSSRDDPLLALHEVETLHHEWGHALHSLLSQTTFQHLAGTRGGPDFIEVPSHLLEYFSRSSEVLSRWAGHYITGEPPPKQLLDDELAAKEDFRAVDLQKQLLYSLADQHLFGPGIGEVSDLSAEEVFVRALRGVSELQQTLTCLSPVRLTRQEAERFVGRSQSDLTELCVPAMNLLTHEHFISYGGGYYSYLLARIYAAQIWEKHFRADPLNRSAGELVRSRMLRYGAGRDPEEILREVAGGELNQESFARILMR